MRLLIIEDDRESADYLVKAFREVGYVADLAGDGEEGLALADSGDYDVLVIDRMLPKRDGLSLIGTLREKGNRTPALILSALGQVDDRIKGLRAGGDDYLPKPYSFAELLARVEVLSRRHGGPAEETAYRDLQHPPFSAISATLTECRHGSYTPRRESYEAAAARSPCRSWSAAAKYARR